MKRSSVLVVSILLIALSITFGCKEKAPKLADGVWTGEGNAYQGKMTVSIAVQNGQITQAELINTADSVYSLETIDSILAQAVLKGNADKLDSISGATGTSNGTIEALKAAQAASEAAATASTTK